MEISFISEVGKKMFQRQVAKPTWRGKRAFGEQDTARTQGQRTKIDCTIVFMRTNNVGTFISKVSI